MRFNVDGKVVVVRFFYKGTGFTVCEILVPGGNGDLQRVSRGSTSCNFESGECFCKRFGRKEALTRALSSFPRNVRTQIWKQYLTQARV